MNTARVTSLELSMPDDKLVQECREWLDDNVQPYEHELLNDVRAINLAHFVSRKMDEDANARSITMLDQEATAIQTAILAERRRCLEKVVADKLKTCEKDKEWEIIQRDYYSKVLGLPAEEV